MYFPSLFWPDNWRGSRISKMFAVYEKKNTSPITTDYLNYFPEMVGCCCRTDPIQRCRFHGSSIRDGQRCCRSSATATSNHPKPRPEIHVVIADACGYSSCVSCATIAVDLTVLAVPLLTLSAQLCFKMADTAIDSGSRRWWCHVDLSCIFVLMDD